MGLLATILISVALLFGGVPPAAPPGIVIDHQPAPTRAYIGSPSIVILGDGSYVASHDLFGPGSTEEVSGVTKVFVSKDRGATWKQTAELKDQYWSNLFVHRKQLYLFGTTGKFGRIVIRRSADGGTTWSAPSYLTTETGYHTSTVPVVVKDGRVWRAFEHVPPSHRRKFQAFVMSAPEKSDLLQPANWTRTNRLPFPSDPSDEQTWLEGNVVVGPDHNLYDILRVHTATGPGSIGERAAVTQVHGATQLTLVKLIHFPGGSTKFTIRYDKVSKRYWTLANHARASEPMTAVNPGGVRNLLCLVSSADLWHWRLERIVLSHPNPKKFAFQYVDWQFDGNDIVAASRTAFDDETGGAHSAHDANFLTFYRVVNFRTNPTRPAD